MTTQPELTKRLAKAKTGLILEYPFVGTVALNMPFEISELVPTAATNGRRVLFNPDFIAALNDDELLFLVAHECLHPMLEHNYRRHERNPRKWNRAADYVINQLLHDEELGTMPRSVSVNGNTIEGLLDKTLYDAGKGITDNIYALLPDQPGDDGQGGGLPGSGMDNCEDGTGTQQEQDAEAALWKVQVAQAAQAAKMMGRLSANMARLVDEVLTPKVNWREVLQRFVEKHRTDERSWARPNRRYVAQGLYLPTISGEAMGELAFAIDCSGSIGQEELNQFAAEVRTVFEDQKPSKIHLLYFDSEVCHYEGFTQEDDLHIEAHGGGGTAFSPVFRYLEEHAVEPVACVFLTDLYCSDFGEQPGYPVLWVSNAAKEAPFGEVVMMT